MFNLQARTNFFTGILYGFDAINFTIWFVLFAQGAKLSGQLSIIVGGFSFLMLLIIGAVSVIMHRLFQELYHSGQANNIIREANIRTTYLIAEGVPFVLGATILTIIYLI